MLKKDCFLIGSVFKLHGYKGNMVIFNEKNLSFKINEMKYFFIDLDNILVPFFIEKISIHKTKNILVKLEEISSEIEAKKYIGKDIYFSKEYVNNTREEAKEHDIVNFLVYDKNLGHLGRVDMIDSQTSQKLIYIKNEQKRFCFPWDKHFIESIEFEKQKLHVQIPEELINLN